MTARATSRDGDDAPGAADARTDGRHVDGPAPYRVVADPDGLLATLSDRRRVLVGAAAAYQALTRPGRRIRLTVADAGDPDAAPRLTADAAGPLDTVLGSIEIESLLPGETSGAFAVAAAILTPDDAAPEPGAAPRGRLRARLDELAERSPLWGDQLRQAAIAYGLRRANRRITDRVPPIAPARPPAPAGAEPAVLIGMYWLEHGGAEKWALRCVELATAAGFHPIVVVDVPGQQALAGSPALAGATVLCVDGIDGDGSERLIAGLLDWLPLAGVLVHHSNWLYAQLPRLRAASPELPVVDSLHVIEWENGGFPMVAARYDAFIDMHHVIADHLTDYLRDVKHVDPAKIRSAPLLALGGTAPIDGRDRRDGARVTIGFVGRAVGQKRPLLFLEVVARLARRFPPGRVRAVFHGDGPLLGDVRRRAAELGLQAVIQFRGPDVPVGATYNEIDFLVIPSQVEGLTLTTMEAGRAGVVVLSADVGAQRMLVADRALLPRAPLGFVRRCVRTIEAVTRSDGARRTMLEEQKAKARGLAEREDADEMVEGILRGWQRHDG